mmetsp:Transcript_27495/g.38256  ORF Transcript_27495/g.38256 Transcript_27495/m.38256 type:complete len:840 (+) Transcript_27495:106-2625(+)
MATPTIVETGTSQYFQESTEKIDETRKMLDTGSDADKLEGMKRLIAMMSKGRDVSGCFPDVVKLVVCQNLDVKKLVYIFLVHYAELQPDNALLAINRFQRELNDPNQLIRAQALRVMSSIRLKMITQIVVMAIQTAAGDISPYVKKTAAHAIPKVYSLDRDHKDALVDIIGVLLNDKNPNVVGSAVNAWTEVCPDNFEIIHKNFRKICNLLAQTDEWGQVSIVNMLCRYARVQFVDPDAKKKKTKDVGSGEENEREEEEEEEEDYDFLMAPKMDPDHRLLLDVTSSLLQSRNSAVVLAVATLYFYCAPDSEVVRVGRPLTRIAKGNPEAQFIVLQNIASMAAKRPGIFSSYANEFFVHSTDPLYVRKLKLEILTYLAGEGNINSILRELDSYVHREESSFVVDAIQAIGKCAMQISDVTESCMYGLMALIQNGSDMVVSESVIVLKKLLQHHTEGHGNLVTHLAKILPTIKDPNAKASIIWVIGEYNEHVRLLAPDILRVLAKSFPDEKDEVKMQTINLAMKLFLSNPKQTELLFQYVLNLAKYDLNYDIRDKTRVLRLMIFDPEDKAPELKEISRDLILTKKPAPSAERPSAQRGERYSLSTLSHMMNHTVSGYQAIPDWPEEAPDPSVRNVDIIGTTLPLDDGPFYSNEESENDESFYSDEYSDEYSDYTDDEFSDDLYEPVQKQQKQQAKQPQTSAKDDYDDFYSDEDDYDSEEEEMRERERIAEERRQRLKQRREGASRAPVSTSTSSVPAPSHENFLQIKTPQRESPPSTPQPSSDLLDLGGENLISTGGMDGGVNMIGGDLGGMGGGMASGMGGGMGSGMGSGMRSGMRSEMI